jgi:hypothetical protein
MVFLRRADLLVFIGRALSMSYMDADHISDNRNLLGIINYTGSKLPCFCFYGLDLLKGWQK